MPQPFIECNHPLDVYRVGEPVEDRFGNLRPGQGEWKPVMVASWWVDKTEEEQGDSVRRTFDVLHVHLRPDDVPGAGGKLRTPDGEEWEIEGNVEDFNHGWHGFAPGLLVVHAKKVGG